MITSQQIAWAAGIFEGEGSCSWTSKEHNCQEAMVCQNDRWLLDKLASVFGGKVSVRQLRNHLSNNPNYRWRLYGADARGFLLTIYSFLSPRRQEQIKKIGVFDKKEA